MRTAAAQTFTNAIFGRCGEEKCWDRFEMFSDTSIHGLSDNDSDYLEQLCTETEESFELAEAEVMKAIQEYVDMNSDCIPYQPPNM